MVEEISKPQDFLYSASESIASWLHCSCSLYEGNAEKHGGEYTKVLEIYIMKPLSLVVLPGI